MDALGNNRSWASQDVDKEPLAISNRLQAYFIAATAKLKVKNHVTLVITPTQNEAEHLSYGLSAFLDKNSVFHFPAWETLPFERISPTMDTMGERLKVLFELKLREANFPRSSPQGDTGGDITAFSEDKGRSDTPLVVVASVRAALQRLCPNIGDINPIFLSLGQQLDIDQLAGQLVNFGYRREYQVEHKGEFAIRGGIVDVYPPTEEMAIRIDLFGDEIDRLTVFDVADQRSVRELDEVCLYSAREFILSPFIREKASEIADRASFAQKQFEQIANGEFFDGLESFLPWFDEDPKLLPALLGEDDLVVLIEPRRMLDRATDIIDEESAIASSLGQTWGVSADEDLPRLHLNFDALLSDSVAKSTTLLATADPSAHAVFNSSPWPVVHGDPAPLFDKVRELCKKNYTVVVCADLPSSARRFGEIFSEVGLEINDLTTFFEVEEGSGRQSNPEFKKGLINIVTQQLEQGFIFDTCKLAILCEPDITRRKRPHRVPKQRKRAVESFFDDLKPGSFVVHNVHGVARFMGMVKRQMAGSERDYLLLEYRGDDKLYVPSDQIDVITPYTSGEKPTLNRLGGGEFQRQKSRARQKVREIAQELVVLYQRRLHTPGFSFSPDTPWQTEMEQSFPYLETADQLQAITEVKSDMESDVPMDRLVCGDVGFGKTEVALRAVFKAIQDGRQAAVLVPTTLLAQQHYQTFTERFAPYPIRIEMLSRFLTPAQQKKVVADVSSGEVDLIVGTHALLSANIKWKKLGLLVIDEEQRFGVSHKEAIKAMSVGVDVLTLTASPIPRTLEMGLTGIRDLSVIDTPPAMRQPILTYVGEYDPRAVSEAIRRELLREGQVFYVHNRVQDIEKTATDLSHLVPEARIAIAHGQMDEAVLEKVIMDFADRSYDVLVCTTIVESGIDMGNVNTLVVDRADLLGLGQMHQLRGRVGRSGQRAYAYLFYPHNKVLSEEAYERLRTIGELTDLGAGFKIAMRDLEIRGAGNLLGNDQSGHIAAMGYDLYIRMVAEAIGELKGEEVQQPADLKMELAVKANIPENYIEREDLRLEAYRLLANVRTEEEVEDIYLQWRDRFGQPPEEALELLEIANLRVLCIKLGIKELSVVPNRAYSSYGDNKKKATARLSPIKMPASVKVRLQRLYPKSVYKQDIQQLILPIEVAASDKSFSKELISILSTLFPG